MADITHAIGSAVALLRLRNTEAIPNRHCKLEEVCKEDEF